MPLLRGDCETAPKYCLWVWALRYRKDIELLGYVQRIATTLLEGLENKTYEEQLRELGLRESGAEERLRGDLIALISYLNEGCSQLGVILFCGTQRKA